MKKVPPSRPFRQVLFLFCTLLLLSSSAACVPIPVERPWEYADLRALGKLAAPTPAADILAVYTRTTALSVDIRVDLLDINPGDDFSLKFAFWDNRYFNQDPLVISVSSSGAVITGGIREGMPAIWPRLIRDDALDTITVSLNRFLVGTRYRVDVMTYLPDSDSPADEIFNIRSDAQPPVNRAPALVAFWDTFPAVTPAQALRRWDGAHTGPLGDRHGLLHILQGAGQYGVPVALLDIKNPASLAALSFMGHIANLKNLSDRGLLILPDTAYGEPTEAALKSSRAAAAGFGLPFSQFIFSNSPGFLTLPASKSGYHAWFLPLSDDLHLQESDGMRLIPIPPAGADQATLDGPSLEVRRALFGAAISSDPTDLVVLGGDLPQSTWGDSDMAYPTFEWIAAHPWIQPLSGPDLLTFPIKTRVVLPAPSASLSPWLEELRSAPENAVTQSAWQTYLTLTAFTTDGRLRSLQNAYLGQVGELLEAAKWAAAPVPQTSCSQDLNQDGMAECILADQKFFALFEPGGARLTQFFYFDSHGPHQVVGPSSQFAVGLSDPSEWHPGSGEAADPSVIAGAFMDGTDTWTVYHPTISADEITFTSPDNSRVKTYQLIEDGIRLLYQTRAPVSTRIALALDPPVFYSAPTDYRASLTSQAWTWNLSGESSIEVQTDAALSAQAFTSAIPFLSQPEDPNLEYPPGNYLPFPLSLVTIQGTGSFYVEINIK